MTQHAKDDKKRGALETSTRDAMPDRHPAISANGHPYGEPATEQQWAALHRDMAPRAAWDFEHSDRVDLTTYHKLAERAPSPAETALTIERHGHVVQVDARGVSIDGQRLPGVSSPTAYEARLGGDPFTSQALQITDRGAVVVHGRIVAAIAPEQEPHIYGPQGPAWARGAGHTVVADERGLCIDGQRVSEQPLPPPVGNAPLRINDRGTATWCVERQVGDRIERRHEPIADLFNPKRPDAPPVLRGHARAPERQPTEPTERARVEPEGIDFDEEIDL